MIWWAELPGRARDEQIAIGDLTESCPWLLSASMRLEKGFRLVFDIDIVIDGETVLLTLKYPELFPDAAPSVFSREGQRLSGHQYGPEGELCLEHRPDNWASDITGAMMIESAYRLLSSEHESGRPAPSDHRVTRAQRTQYSTLRFLYAADTLIGLAMVPKGEVAEAEVVEQNTAKTFVAQLSRIGSEASEIWVADQKRGGETQKFSAVIVRISGEIEQSCKNFEDLRSLLWIQGLGDLATDLANTTNFKFVIVQDGRRWITGLVFGQKFISYDPIFTEPERTRLDPEYHRLSNAKVAIVGCGSVGSKVAAQLARSGVSNFVLIDGDIFATGNLVRNELDWRSVGVHKAPALGSRIKEINPDATVDTRTNPVGGQESGASASATISAVRSCDLIIDATAEPSVFNFCAAIALRSKKPLFWAQVFGGGSGGIVARLRPDIDPVPLVARQRLVDWYREQNVQWPENGTEEPYAEVSEEGAPLIADDADVTVISSHLSRFVIDLLARPDETIFPYSAYVIGLRDHWLFAGPFDVYPIDLGEGGDWGTNPTETDKEALEAFVADLLANNDDEG